MKPIHARVSADLCPITHPFTNKDASMIDIETLATVDRRGKIVQIGLVHFNMEGITDAYQWTINPNGGLNAKRRIEDSTMKFWNKQPQEIQDQVIDYASPITLDLALAELFQAISTDSSPKYHKVWANHTHFDISFSDTAYLDSGIKSPLHFRNMRDYATLKALHSDIKMDEKGDHQAVTDARVQALHLIKILKATGRTLK